MQKVTPWLWFDGKAEEAMNFYCSVFKDAEPGKIERYGPGGPMPEGTVLTASFKLFGQEYVALNGGPQFKFTEAVSFHISCDTQQEIDYYWSNLTAGGGEESMCGWVKDKYGLSWQVVPTQLNHLLTTGTPEQRGRVMKAMLQMRKIEIDRLEAAHAE